LTLSKDEIQRYSRHLIVPEVGMEGQLKLKGAKVLLVGTGGLPPPASVVSASWISTWSISQTCSAR
jgi:adenylyltransferase/sulfurtransferase